VERAVRFAAVPRIVLGSIEIVLALPKGKPEVIVRLQTISQCMTENAALFPSPPVSMPSFAEHVASLLAAQASVDAGYPGARQQRDAAFVLAVRDAKQLCSYVNILAVKNKSRAAALAAAAGMVLRKFGGRTVQDLIVETLGEGVVLARARGVPRAKAYQFDVSVDGGATYTLWGSSTGPRCELKGLAFGTLVLVRVRALTKDGMTDWGPPVRFAVGSPPRLGRRRRR
jgi:hypothetical protein